MLKQIGAIMRLSSFAVAASLLMLVPVRAQSVVILKMNTDLPTASAFSTPASDGSVRLILASGTMITVPATDIDLSLMRSIAGLPTQSTEPSGPSLNELLLSPSAAEAAISRRC